MRGHSLLLAALGLVAVAAVAYGDLIGRGSHPAILMSFTFGSGPDQIDTTCVDPEDPFRAVVQSFRVNPDGSVWILAGRAGEQSLRRFRSSGGLAREIETIALPGDRCSFSDFIFIHGAVVLSRLVGDDKELAAFCRFTPGETSVQEVSLPYGAGFNLYRGQRIANLGRLRVVADTLYDCYDRNGSCVRIGGERLFSSLGAKDVLAGSPTIDGEPVWCDGMQVFHGIHPILDLRAGGPAVIEDVLEDGGFVIRRIAEMGGGRRGPLDLYEMYAEDGRPLRSIVIPRNDPDGLGVGDGEDLFFSMPWIYRLAFRGSGCDLERY